jgi:hypothetical protein
MRLLSILPLTLWALFSGISVPASPYHTGDDPVLDYTTVSVHTVQQGTMPFHTKGRGMIAFVGPNARARVQILLFFARNLKIAHPASVKIVGVCGALTGKVTKIGELRKEEAIPVDVAFDQALPPDVRAGDSADALIEYGRIENALYMERGFFDTANADVALFRVDPDEKHATRVTVHFGVIASEMIEIKSGLRGGDKVIVSDMSRYLGYDRISIK